MRRTASPALAGDLVILGGADGKMVVSGRRG
jgi:hypothetical protein